MQEEVLLRLVDFKGAQDSGSQENDQINFDIVRRVQSELPSYCKNAETFVSDNDRQKFSIILTDENIHQNINVLKLITNSIPESTNNYYGNQNGSQKNSLQVQSNMVPNYPSLPNPSIQQNNPYMGNCSNKNYPSSSYNSNNSPNYSNKIPYNPNIPTGMYENPQAFPPPQYYPKAYKKKKSIFEIGWDMMDKSFKKFFN